jgi:outer membrane protein assembly factor BamB
MDFAFLLGRSLVIYVIILTSNKPLADGAKGEYFAMIKKHQAHLLHIWGSVSKNCIVIFVVVTAFLLGGISTLVPLTLFHTSIVAKSAGTALTVTPSSGPYSNRNDQTPISVAGKSFTPLETVQVYWNYTSQSDGTLVTMGTANKYGNFSASFNSQLAATGTYTIAAIGQTSQLIETGTYTLLPQFYPLPQASGPATVTTAYGNAFAAGETIDIYWNYKNGQGKLLGTAVGDSNGSFSVNVTIPPRTTPGLHEMAGVGQTSHEVSTYFYTVYQPTLALAPISGSSGTTLTVSAYGFTGLEIVDIYWNNSPTPITSLATSGYGYLPPTAIDVPAGQIAGSYPVTITGESSHISVTNSFTVVAPSFTLSPANGPGGVPVLLQGQGYTPGETVDISWQPSPRTVDIATAVAGPSGIIQSQFLAPPVPAGTYTVSAVGRISHAVIKQTFTVANGLAASPSSGAPGSTITANGMGYQANEQVQLYWDTTANQPFATVLANQTGNIQKSFALPANITPGNHTLIGVGATSGISFSAPETVNTNWGDFGYLDNNHRNNTTEDTLNNSNVANLTLKWTATASTGGLEGSPVYSNGLVYQPTMDGSLNAYNATTGALVWQFDCKCPFSNVSSPVADPVNNLVFIGTEGFGDEGIPSPFFALNAATGSLVWSSLLDWRQVGFPTLAGGTLYVGTSHEQQLNSSMYAIDELTGLIRWQYTSTTGFWGAVGVDTAQNIAISGMSDPADAIIAFNATTGAVLWQTTVPHFTTDDDVGSGISIQNGNVFASSKNGYVYDLSEMTGAIKWSTLVGTQGDGNISTPALSSTGTLYVGSIDDDLYAISTATGAILWKTPTKANIFSSPALANGVVYIASFDKNFYAVDAQSGAILWTYTTGSQSYGSPIVVNGWLYCSSTNGTLYAFSL